ncbi:DUF6443 domain-containing protein [Emticicia agri]|uniref:DUF6443 domain-containing protein n=1 Tax=Emticicia agri TaxID=2492393 RepID=A0A4Q5LTR7_9BACT|nr:DUF6443 domain-containing protein [Emticicia agri]RYU93031.1 hypothetical protein EWM59_24080 [Emticicia agri]
MKYFTYLYTYKRTLQVALSCCLYLGLTIFANGQTLSPDKNAVTYSKLRIPTTNIADASDATKALISISYFDGLGRPLQTVGYKQSPTLKDIITESTQYDAYSRVVQKYLPTPFTDGTGSYQTNVAALGLSFYADAKPFSSVLLYESSPLNREKESMGPGIAWQTNNKKSQIFYESAGADVRLYRMDASGNIVKQGAYPENTIFKKRLIDEQGNTTIVYTDKADRVIQKQQQDNSGTPPASFITTYYIYDDFDRLAAVIQPEGYELNSSIARNSDEWNKWVFFYEYDQKGRLRRKKVPAAEEEYMIYDRWDRLVWSQTALQREQNKWTFYKYDAFNREIIRGEKTDTRSFNAIETEAHDWNYDRYESRVTGGPIYYSYSNAYPQVFNTDEIRHVTYYDTYNDWVPSEMAFVPANAYHTRYADARGMATGNRSRNSENNNWMASVSYYDSKARAIQVFSHNLYGHVERVDFQYNQAGETLTTRSESRDVNNASTTQLEQWEYDHAGRKTVYKLGIGSSTETIAKYEYDEVGRLKTKKIYPDGNFIAGGAAEYINRPPNPTSNVNDLARKAINLDEGTTIDGASIGKYSATIDPNAADGTNIINLQTIDYAYHIRGGLRGINLDGSGNPVPDATQGDLFSYKLDYETAGFYDGNIGKQTWQSAQNNTPVGLRAYTFTYDPISRLKSATYAGINGENYSLADLTYDKNGNIKTLRRKGLNDGSFGDIDNLTYTYSGNTLLGVTDAINGNEDVGDFRDNGSNSDYTYWNDGSLKSDANKDVSQITYDSFLKRIKQIDFANGDWVKFFYDGNGTLLRRSNSLEEVWDYTSKGIYKNNLLYQFSQQEGRIVKNGSSFDFEFEYRDIWNNLRVNYKNENGKLITTQTADFDMLGLELKTGQSGSNNFRFQQQERLFDFGLNWDLFKYRPSDSQIGRFIQIDPLTEKMPSYSPYSFAFNNPVRFIDPDGAAPVDITLLGANNSSVTIKTDLIDVKVDASSLGVNFGGNYTLEGNDILQAGLDIVGVFDPTGIADGINAVLSAKSGNYGDAIISGLGVLPYAGDLAKAGKIEKDIKIIDNAIDAVKGEAKLSKTGKFTEPSLPKKNIVSENGVSVEHYYKSGDHAPAHMHVSGGGAKTKIGANGKPIKGSPELSGVQKQVVENNKSAIRSAGNKINKYQQYQNYLSGQ